MGAGHVGLRPGSKPSALVADACARADEIERFGTDVPATLAWCADAAESVRGASRGIQWELLANTALRDVAAARILEPHLDALTILDEAGLTTGDLAAVGATSTSTWGVFAAEGRGLRVDARAVDGGWRLDGTKPWCSLAGVLSHALVTAHVDGGRRLFAVDLRGDGVRAHEGPWLPRGLPHIVSAPVDFDDVPAVPVGDTGWYLSRPGFALGGIGVAACWWGGAAGLLAALARAAARDDADQIAGLHAGRADAALWAARASIAEASDLEGTVTPVVAARVRAITAAAAEAVLREADHALGPAPLVADEGHARRVADLHLYLRQHHGERDLAGIGRNLAGALS